MMKQSDDVVSFDFGASYHGDADGQQVCVLLADDHDVVRQGISLLLEASDVKVVGEARDGHETLSKIRTLKPDVVVLDIAMPGMNGIDVTRRILVEHPLCRILMLSACAEERWSYHVMRAGAKGYLHKDCTRDELVTGIKRIHRGELVFKLVDDSSDANQSTTNQHLSARELQVLQLIGDGFNTKDIAFQLGLSAKTVEFHRSNMMSKLNLFTVAELTKYAIREGLVFL